MLKRFLRAWLGCFNDGSDGLDIIISTIVDLLNFARFKKIKY